MAGRSTLEATKQQRSELEELARSGVRGEADRARAILLTLSGWTGPQVAEAFGVTAGSIRHWRQWFAESGVEASRSTLAPGPSPERGERALERGADLRVAAPGQSRKVATIGALDAVSRELIVHTSATKRSTDFIALPEVLDRRFGPRPGRQSRPVVLVLDNGPIHTSKASTAALEARPWITVEWLPRYSPELNDIELSWRGLKRHHLAHRTFADAAELDRAIPSLLV